MSPLWQDLKTFQYIHVFFFFVFFCVVVLVDWRPEHVDGSLNVLSAVEAESATLIVVYWKIGFHFSIPFFSHFLHHYAIFPPQPSHFFFISKVCILHQCRENVCLSNTSMFFSTHISHIREQIAQDHSHIWVIFTCTTAEMKFSECSCQIVFLTSIQPQMPLNDVHIEDFLTAQLSFLPLRVF